MRHTEKFVKDINKHDYSEKKLFTYGMELVTDRKSPIWMLIEIWKAYVEYEIKDTHEKVHKFLVHELNNFT